ncbi:MAG: ABC transporter permease [Eubacteriales bacterium]
MKKIFVIFGRDVRVNVKNFMAMFIILFPILVAVGINMFSPGINDTTVNLALLKEDTDMVSYYQDFAKVEVFKTEADVEDRVARRDNFVGILPDDNGEYYILIQGDEPQNAVVEFAQVLKALYEVDAQIEDSNAVLHDFGKTVPPLKNTLVNSMILMVCVLGGMLISLNIVEEKMDNTVSAINVTPMSRASWIFGKSMVGLFLPLIGSFAMVLITGFNYINYAQLMVLVLTSVLISIMIGFIQGLNADDMMTAVAGTKTMMMPLVGSVVGAELVNPNWQWCFYWSPFYWMYKGNKLVLSGTGDWPHVLLYAGIVLGISALVYIYLAPRIRKGLEKV